MGHSWIIIRLWPINGWKHEYLRSIRLNSTSIHHIRLKYRWLGLESNMSGSFSIGSYTNNSWIGNYFLNSKVGSSYSRFALCLKTKQASTIILISKSTPSFFQPALQELLVKKWLFNPPIPHPAPKTLPQQAGFILRKYVMVEPVALKCLVKLFFYF